MEIVVLGADGSNYTFSVSAIGFTDIKRVVTVFGSKFVPLLAFATPTAASRGRRVSW